MDESRHKNKTFKTEREFEIWLKENTKYKVTFEDNRQDFSTWWIDERGEVLHSNLQSRIWNGHMVDTYSLKEGKKLQFLRNEELIHKIKKVEVMKNG